ncbi:MAG: hypothetical protein AAFV53_32530 [Myxococcota bacterium]
MSSAKPPTPDPGGPIPPGARSATLPLALGLAHRLAQRREHVELQGTVIHRSRDLTLAATAAAAAIAALLGLIAPPLGLLGVALVLMSGYRDLEGGSGWVRRMLVLKDLGHNVIVWRSLRTLPAAAPQTYKRRPPRPPHRSLDSGPILILLAPSDGDPDRPDLLRAVLKTIGLIAFILAGLGIVWGATLALWATGLFIFIGTVAWSRHLTRPPSRAPASHIEDVLTVIDATQKTPPKHLALSFVFMEGLSGHADAVEIFLRNYAPMLPRDTARILVLTPGTGPIAVIEKEGWLRRRAADPLIVNTTPVKLDAYAVTPAARALRVGHPAATVRGDLSDTQRILDIIARLDHAAAEGQW